MMAELVGQQFGNYRLNGLLGRGGFAEVYLGEHIYLDTLAAIKVLHLQLTDEAQTDFLNEARTIARLEHPHIVGVLEFGVENYVPFLVMSYASNGTLRHRCPRGIAQPATSIIPYMKQIASALDYAHEQKLIHRDVKPENILLDASNKVLLSDFGLAMLSQSMNRAHLEDRAGTAAYMAPEQIQGKSCPASDQYALGVVVYEWLTGSWPFEGSDLAITLQHLYTPPPSLCERAPMLVPEIEQVVMRALSKDPAQRFPCVQDFTVALEQAVCDTLSISSLPTPVSPQDIETRLPVIDNLGQSSRPPKIITSRQCSRESSTLRPIVAPEPANTPRPIPLHPPRLPDSDAANVAEADTRILPPQKLDSPKLLVLAEASQPSSFSPSESTPPFPVPQLPLSSSEGSKQHFNRRAILLGLTGAVVAGATGAGLTILFFSSKFSARQGISYTGRQTSHGLTPTSSSGTTGASAGNGTPLPTRGSTSTPRPDATPTHDKAPADNHRPGPALTSTLTVQIENPPSSFTNGQTASINVLTSEPKVMVTLNVNYNVASPKTTTVTQKTDNNGQAVLSWKVDVTGKHEQNNSQIESILNVSAVDMNGKQVQPQQLIIPVNVQTSPK